MTSQGAIILDADAERRWNEWLARGAAADGRSAARVGILMVIVATALGVWLTVQLT